MLLEVAGHELPFIKASPGLGESCCHPLSLLIKLEVLLYAKHVQFNILMVPIKWQPLSIGMLCIMLTLCNIGFTDVLLSWKPQMHIGCALNYVIHCVRSSFDLPTQGTCSMYHFQSVHKIQQTTQFKQFLVSHVTSDDHLQHRRT